MAKISEIEITKLLMDEGAAPSTPAATNVAIYAKADGLIYSKDDAGTETLMSSGSAAGVGNLWTMSKSASQTLTSNTLTQITFDVSQIDGGGSVIDLANDKFETPATGLYMCYFTWLWETTTPAVTAHISVKVGSTESISLVRISPATANVGANGGLSGSGPLSLTAADDVTMWIHPGGAVTPTARGNASVHLSTSFTLQRIT